MTNFGATVNAEIEKLNSRMDELLDKLIVVLAERDAAREEAQHLEAELAACYETNGHVIEA